MMKLILYLFYNFSKQLILKAGRLFYRRTVISNRENLDFEPPVILVVNHPNTLMDILNSASKVKNRVFFLANASLYQSKFGNWFFSNFYCIKVERPQDVDGKAISNETAFKATGKFLANGGVFWIAPQGVSKLSRSIGKLKTGTARMALSAENEHDFKLNLKILPIGLNYEAPTRFRKDLFINVGEPISVKAYRESYGEDAFGAAKEITEAIRSQFEELIFDINDDEEQLISTFENIAFYPERPAPDAAFAKTKQFVRNWRTFQDKSPEAAATLRQKVENYQNALQQANIDDHAVAGKRASLFSLFAGFPVFLYGWLNNILAAMIPLWLIRKINIYAGYDATIKFLGGTISFGIMYLIQGFAVQKIFQNGWITMAYLLSLIPAGIFAWYYHQKYKTFKNSRRLQQLDSTASESIKQQRNEILETCNKAIF